jgi:hypothetical protein
MEQYTNNFYGQTEFIPPQNLIKSSNKKSKKLKTSEYNTDFSSELKKKQLELEREFEPISKEYKFVKLLGKGSYGIVIKVYYFLILGIKNFYR